MELSAEKIIPLGARICIDETTEAKVKPERGVLEPSSTGTGPGAPRQQRLSNWEM